MRREVPEPVGRWQHCQRRSGDGAADSDDLLDRKTLGLELIVQRRRPFQE